MNRILFALSLIMGTNVYAGTVHVYSSRTEELIRPLFERFQEETSIEVRSLTDSEAALIERLAAEGAKSPADILLTVDAGNLWHAAERGLLQPVQSKVLEANVPASLRDEKGRWFGYSVRARTIAYSTERVKPSELSTYADLASDKWKGRLCLRTSKKVYNQSLVAMMIAELGEKTTEGIVKGWVGNLAAPVFPNDTKVLEAIAAGKCDVGIVNTYYFGRLQAENPKIPVALFWPDQKGSGVHVNVSGAGLTAHAPNKADAIKLLEWLSTSEAQKIFAELNLEYPANDQVPMAPAVKAWGEFKRNPLNVAKAGEYQAQATKLMDRVGYR